MQPTFHSKNIRTEESEPLPIKTKRRLFIDPKNIYLNSSTGYSTRTKKSKSILSFMKPDNETSQKKKLKSSKKDISAYLRRVFQKPEEKYKKQFHWPKITHPKLPFSNRNIEPIEERKKRIKDQSPSPLFHNFYTIQWLRHKYSDSLIEKCVYTMLPDNGRPVIPDDETEEQKKHRILMEYLDSLKLVPEREKNVIINPKYFFDKKTFEKILKFKEIFLEFDEDGSRKMEIDEMVEMFNQNHINANTRELVDLFFKGKQVKEEDIMKLYLDFYQFMNFALTKDQDFREFMRGIKQKNLKNEEKLKMSKNNEEEKKGYLPMNFNLMLDYFIIKGKERASIEAIENSINEMDKIIEKKDYKNLDKTGYENIISSKKNIRFNVNSEELHLDKNNSNKENNFLVRPSTKRFTKFEVNDDKEENSKYFDDQLKNLNFCDLIENFSTLFHVEEKNEADLKQQQTNKSLNNFKDKLNKMKLENKQNPDNMKKDLNDSLNSKDEEKVMKKLIKTQMNKNVIKKMNMTNYEKFHNIKLALDTTKDQIKSIKKLTGNDINGIYKCVSINSYNDKSHIRYNTNNNIGTEPNNIFIKDYKNKNNILYPFINNNQKSFLSYRQNKINNIIKYNDKANLILNKKWNAQINNNLISEKTFDENNTFNKKIKKKTVSEIQGNKYNTFYSCRRKKKISYDPKSKYSYVPPELLLPINNKI